MELPAGWVLALIATLGATIAALARTFYASLQKQIDQANERSDRQDQRHKESETTIANLQREIFNMSNGCGVMACLWRKPSVIPSASLPDPKPTDAGKPNA